jgi:nicotinic acid mononucleotide adenylyltransferase
MSKLKWKIDRDPYYSKLYEKYGEEHIIDAGFFEDTASEDIDINASLDIECTPYHFLKKRLIESDNPCVILSTGSFSPVHNGHVEMMVKAKECLEKNGWDVVGGYLAPDHDEYIHHKLGDEAIPFHYRMKAALDAISDEDWLTIDPWAGVFHTNAVNFTDIIVRLERYLERYLGKHIPVFFVFGGDNANFVQTFELEGHCVVVSRPGYEEDVKFYLEGLKLDDSDRIYWATNNNGLSSTNVRKVQKWQMVQKELIVRHDDKADSRDEQIMELLRERFDDVIEVNAADQQLELELISGKIINLDSLTKSHFNLEISRLYDSFGIKQLGYTHRPNSVRLSLQGIEIPKEDGYFLFDDDICSGGTIDFATNLLKDRGIKVVGSASFFKSKNKQEVIDIRDFLFNTKNGGLVVLGRDDYPVRYPYIYPFVCPFVRSSINDPKRFSKKVWEINMEYFYKAGDMNNYIICKYYRDMIDKYIYRPK